MKCEICGETATMWVEGPCEHGLFTLHDWYTSKPLESGDVPMPWFDGDCLGRRPIPSCDDCGPQLDYKILAPLVANIRSDAD